MKGRRAYLVLWIISAIVSVVAPVLEPRGSWPKAARDYEQWLLYSAPWHHLPFSAGLLPVAGGLLLLAAGLLWWNVVYGRLALVAGLLLHMYATYSTIPALVFGVQSVAHALFYFASGSVFVASSPARQSRAEV